MNTETNVAVDATFKKDVLEGLSSFPKYLYSKYIYDSTGDRLFQDIMKLPEYYLTNSEYEIFQLHKSSIADFFRGLGHGFDLIELGAGDGEKTKVLLEHFINRGLDFVYKPIDISENALSGLADSLRMEFSELEIAPERGEYFEVLQRLGNYDKRKKVIMLLGSNMGNLLHDRAIQFLSQLSENMNEDDLLFMGLDQKKDPQVILDAYNDPTGVTEAFNKNLLTRINRELGGNFDLDKFKHWEVYDPETGTAKSYLVSLETQEVTIAELGETFNFKQWETIHTEISQKYDDAVVEWLAEESGLSIESSFSDSKEYFKNYIFRKK